MREIVKVLLQEGIDEETIHEVLDVLYEELNKERIERGIAKMQGLEAEQVERGGAKGNRTYLSKHDRSNLIQKLDAHFDPERKKRKELLGKAIKPESVVPEYEGGEVIKKMRVERKKQEAQERKK